MVRRGYPRYTTSQRNERTKKEVVDDVEGLAAEWLVPGIMDNLHRMCWASTQSWEWPRRGKADLEEVIQERVQVAVPAEVQTCHLHDIFYGFTPAYQVGVCQYHHAPKRTLLQTGT